MLQLADHRDKVVLVLEVLKAKLYLQRKHAHEAAQPPFQTKVSLLCRDNQWCETVLSSSWTSPSMLATCAFILPLGAEDVKVTNCTKGRIASAECRADVVLDWPWLKEP